MDKLIYLVPAMGIIGLLYTFVKFNWVSKQDAGSARMKEISTYIAEGAMAFLKAEWKILGYFVVIVAILLAVMAQANPHSHYAIAIAFIFGAVFSATAGYIGMRVATKANVRTTQAAKTSLSQALKVSFTGGSVMGLGVAGLAVEDAAELGQAFEHIVCTGVLHHLADPRAGDVAIEFTAEEAALKRQTLACYASERGNLKHIETVRESCRPLPCHDYSAPPHSRRLFRERFHWVPFEHPRVDFEPSAMVYAEIGRWASAAAAQATVAAGKQMACSGGSLIIWRVRPGLGFCHSFPRSSPKPKRIR